MVDALLRSGKPAVLVAAVCALAVLATTARTQEQPGEGPVVSDLTERVEVRLVELSVLALDSDGTPVEDLTADDLALVIDEQPYEIAFVHPSWEPDPEDERPWARLSVEAGFQTPASESGQHPPHYYVFFLDLVNEPPARRSNPGETLSRFVHEQIRDGDRAAVLSYGGSLSLDLPFTADREALSHTIQKVMERAGASASRTRQRVRNLKTRLDMCVYVPDAPLWLGTDETEDWTPSTPIADESCVIGVASSYSSELTSRAAGFLNALASAVGFASSVRGRTTVVALTHGVALEADDVILAAYTDRFGAHQVDKVEQGLSRTREVAMGFDRLVQYGVQEAVTLHFVDASKPPTGGGGAGSRGFMRGSDPMAVSYSKPWTYLQRMADTTAGALVTDPDLGRALDRLREIERGRYVVGFYTDVVLDSRALKELSLSTSDKSVSLVTARNQELERFLSSTNHGSIKMGAPVPLEERAGDFLPFRIVVPQAALGHRRVGERMLADLTLHMRLVDERGQYIADSFHFFQHAYPAAETEGRDAAQLSIRGWLEAEPGRYRLDGVFRNARTGAEVNVTQDFAVGD